MDWQTNGVIESVGGSEGFEQLVERGRQLHNQAVFELFARLVSSAMLSLKKSRGAIIEKQSSGNHGRGVCLKQTS
ncbi:MAG: hypothetical protein PVH87_25525 [Desulfobacteraceae bacterium]|jgi:hypothetical protein